MSKLRELIEKATPGPITVRFDDAITMRDSKNNQLCIWTHLNTRTGGRRDPNEVEANAKLAAYMLNHAESIADLIDAAEDHVKMWDIAATHGLYKALAKLTESERK